MSKSEAYRLAIAKVIEANTVRTLDKVDVLEVLFDDYKSAKWSEKTEAEKKLAGCEKKEGV